MTNPIARLHYLAAALQVADLGTTWLGLGMGLGEGNPLMARLIAHSPAAWATLKLALAAGLLGGARFAWGRLPAWAGRIHTTNLFVSNGVMVAVVLSNIWAIVGVLP